MSEMPRFGRSGIYFWTLLFFVLFQLPTGYAVNMAMFLVFRFITGVFGSPTLSTGGATMMDMYDMGAASIAIPIWGAFAIISPCLGPVLGGFVSPVKGWSWSIWMIVWLTTFVLVTMFFFNPETSAANILYRRAARRRQATGDPRFKSQSEIDAANHTLKDDMIVLGRAFSLIFTEPIVFVMDLYVALIYGVLFIWFESFPLVFGGVYHFNLGEQGLAFFGILVGTTITVIAYCLWVIYILIPKFSDPTFKPEVVLPPVWFGSLSLPICLFFYGWTARASIHWIVPIIATTLFGVPLVVVFQSCLNYLAISYPTYAASIFAGNGLFRSIFGAIFPLFVGYKSSLFCRLHKANEKGTTIVSGTRDRWGQLSLGRDFDLLYSHSVSAVLCKYWTSPTHFLFKLIFSSVALRSGMRARMHDTIFELVIFLGNYSQKEFSAQFFQTQ